MTRGRFGSRMRRRHFRCACCRRGRASGCSTSVPRRAARRCSSPPRGAEVTALDLSPTRLGRLRENLARTKLTAELVEADALDWEGGSFDAVLLDAPCSATGTIRRHPDLPLARDGTGIAELCALQSRLIDAALRRLAPGGRLVFCTCSLLPEEGEAQVAAALARHPGLRVRAAAGDWIDPRWLEPGRGPPDPAGQLGRRGRHRRVLHRCARVRGAPGG